jgi:hypothetical protein
MNNDLASTTALLEPKHLVNTPQTSHQMAPVSGLVTLLQMNRLLLGVLSRPLLEVLLSVTDLCSRLGVELTSALGSKVNGRPTGYFELWCSNADNDTATKVQNELDSNGTALEQFLAPTAQNLDVKLLARNLANTNGVVTTVLKALATAVRDQNGTLTYFRANLLDLATLDDQPEDVPSPLLVSVFAQVGLPREANVALLRRKLGTVHPEVSVLVRKNC